MGLLENLTKKRCFFGKKFFLVLRSIINKREGGGGGAKYASSCRPSCFDLFCETCYTEYSNCLLYFFCILVLIFVDVIIIISVIHWSTRMRISPILWTPDNRELNWKKLINTAYSTFQFRSFIYGNILPSKKICLSLETYSSRSCECAY